MNFKEFFFGKKVVNESSSAAKVQDKTEKPKDKPETFCYMLYMKPEEQEKLKELQQSLNIESGTLVDPEEFHCTVRYAKLKPGQTHELFTEWLDTLSLQTLKAYVEKFSIFGSEKDVLVAELDSQDLHDWNAKIDGWMAANGYAPSDYPKYKPHITLAEGVTDAPKFDKFKHRIEVKFTIHRVTNSQKKPVLEKDSEE